MHMTKQPKADKYNEIVTAKLMENYLEVLGQIGEDPSREGLEKTPERVAKAMQFLTSGYKMDAAEILKGAMFKEDYRNMVRNCMAFATRSGVFSKPSRVGSSPICSRTSW